MRVARQICIALLALQVALLSGFSPTADCCLAEREAESATCDTHQSSTPDHCAAHHQAEAQTHQERQCCATQKETSLTCLCQDGERKLPFATLERKGVNCRTARELPVEAATWQWFMLTRDRHPSVTPDRRSHAPPGGSFRLNLKI